MMSITLENGYREVDTVFRNHLIIINKDLRNTNYEIL